MDYWTFLVITLAGPLDGYVSTIPYRSIEECNAAMETVPRTMATTPTEMVQCVETDTLARSLRPKRRPEGLTDD